MKITGIHHVSIAVHDMERAVGFYRDVLGLQEIGIPSTFPAAGLRVRWFKLGEQQIHLLPSKQPDTPGGRHVALHVDDIEAAREHFRSRGVEVRDTVEIPGADRFFIADPEGNRIEVIQWFDTYHIVPIE